MAATGWIPGPGLPRRLHQFLEVPNLGATDSVRSTCMRSVSTEGFDSWRMRSMSNMCASRNLRSRIWRNQRVPRALLSTRDLQNSGLLACRDAGRSRSALHPRRLRPHCRLNPLACPQGADRGRRGIDMQDRQLFLTPLLLTVLRH